MQSIFSSRIGIGTDKFGSDYNQDLRALHYAIDIGYCLIDTAERYMDRLTEEIVGQCLKERSQSEKDKIQIITKVQPHNPIIETCMESLRRLRRDYIDCYLLHWRGDVDLESAVTQMLELQTKGYVKHYGVSNFNKNDLLEWRAIESKLKSTVSLSANQIKYNYNDRTAEHELIPYHQNNNIVTIAYSPLDKGKAVSNPELILQAEQSGLTPAQMALSWILDTPGTIVIPKSKNEARIKENFSIASKHTVS